MKFTRLALTSCATAIVCLLYFYLFDEQKLYEKYRCLRGARHWYDCYRHKEFDFTTDLDGMVYEGSTRDGIDREILKYGAYEKQVLHFLRDVMQSVYSNRGLFLDVGAHTGQHSMFMSRYATEVHAFEPYEPVLGKFRRMIEINKITNIVLYPVGLGSETARKPFYLSGSFIEGFSRDNMYNKELEIVVGDEVLEKANVPSVDLIKMDIEGYEKFALRGLARTLARHRPIVVFEISINPRIAELFKSKEDIQKVFPHDYEFLVYVEWDPYTGYYQLAELDRIVRFDKPWQYEVVAYPLEKKSRIPRRSPR